MKAWEEVPTEAIKKAFVKSGIFQAEPSDSNSDGDDAEPSTSAAGGSTTTPHPFDVSSDEDSFSGFSSAASSGTDN